MPDPHAAGKSRIPCAIRGGGRPSWVEDTLRTDTMAADLPIRPEGARPMQVRDLSQFRHLFRDQEALEEFAKSLESATEGGASQVLTLKGRPVCAAVDLERHRELLYDHLVETLAKRPNLVGELRAALDDDDVVDG